MGNGAFIWRRRVGFGDCDPARIAYTGRIPDFALEAIDAFWEDLLDGDNWFRMNVDQGFGCPFVHMEMDFKVPITPRAPLFCHVEPARLGTTSITFRVVGMQDGHPCFIASFVAVFVVAGELRKIPVPDHIRAPLLERYAHLRQP
ncbi:acyl-CoA thioesterase [Xanthobacter autotrophicus]|uniref:acyl-CoA thioesterase n=1 Tax=Xanthobacter autotrophicus TaxID=280 RepID=UPI0024A6986F|nr:thioesterase family protein [Xanthobacter autotrophicus]MDI4655584.1 acyl-CoA thioesterase [Xanthobacter autotrophicus]